MTFSLTFSTFC